jgi:hypothetical protein
MTEPPSGAGYRHSASSKNLVEMILLIVPVVLGQGRRPFSDADLDIALDLVDSRVDSKGVTIQVYRPNGRTHYATG